jgi:RHS repeat-associated protein
MEPKRNRNLTVADSNKKRNYNEEGRLTPKTGGCYQLEYTLKDHLGNARITFADVNVNGSINAACEILQEETYYPFGLQKSGLNTSIADVENKYQYNGKEFNDELGLNMFDYGARWYMADLGRWGAIDPMIETYPSFSPYNYVLNNPMIFIDPDGRTEYFNLNGKSVYKIEDDKDDRLLLLTSSKKEKDVSQVISDKNFVNVPSDEVVSTMVQAFENTEGSGKENGFRVGEQGIISKIVEGSEKELSKDDVLEMAKDLVAKGDLVAYDVHAHPKGKPEIDGKYGSTIPYETDKNNVIGSQANIILGYIPTETTIYPNGNTMGGQTKVDFKRGIGFYFRDGNVINKIDFSQYKKAVNIINKQ